MFHLQQAGFTVSGELRTEME